jgi:hypothetical protein
MSNVSFTDFAAVAAGIPTIRAVLTPPPSFTILVKLSPYPVDLFLTDLHRKIHILVDHCIVHCIITISGFTAVAAGMTNIIVIFYSTPSQSLPSWSHLFPI